MIKIPPLWRGFCFGDIFYVMKSDEAQVDKVEKKHGGYRKGAGMKKGAKIRKTIVKELELQYIKDRVSAAKDVLINSQIHLATGISYLYCIHTSKKGIKEKPRLVTAQFEIEAYLNGDYEKKSDDYYYITTEKPENPAIMGLLDRILGKPSQSIDLTSKGKEIKGNTIKLVGFTNGTEGE